jgi:hypothetical protein
MPPAVRRWRPQRRTASTWTTLGIIALAVVGVVVAVVWNLRALAVVDSCPRVVDVTGDATVDGHAPAITRVQPGERLAAGQGGTMRLQWSDHTIVDLGVGAEATVVADPRKHLALMRGDCGGLVIGPDGVTGLVLDLPGGHLEVAPGTRFTVIVQSRASHIDVQRGRLQLYAGTAPPREVVAPDDAVLPIPPATASPPPPAR